MSAEPTDAGRGGEECGRCEGTGDLYVRTYGPIAICPDCGGRGLTPPAAPQEES